MTKPNEIEGKLICKQEELEKREDRLKNKEQELEAKAQEIARIMDSII